MSWHSFLRNIADYYKLSGTERDIFMERFNEYNYEKNEIQIIADLKRNLRIDIDETEYKKALK